MGEPAAAPPHVYVINDTPEIVALFKLILEEEGYRVTTDNFTAGTPGSRLAAVVAAQPDLVLLDFMIGREPLGWQFLQMLWMTRATVGIPVVVCTAAVKTAEEIRPRLLEHGVGLVLKPFDIDELLEAVRHTLARRDAGELGQPLPPVPPV